MTGIDNPAGPDRFCPRCGRSHSGVDAFCRSCGTALAGADIPAAPGPPPPAPTPPPPAPPAPAPPAPGPAPSRLSSAPGTLDRAGPPPSPSGRSRGPLLVGVALTAAIAIGVGAVVIMRGGGGDDPDAGPADISVPDGAFDRPTERWRADLVDGLAVTADTDVVVALEDKGAAGATLRVWDLDRGAEQWSADIDFPHAETAPVNASLDIVDGHLVTTVEGPERARVDSYDLSSGQHQWSADFDDISAGVVERALYLAHSGLLSRTDLDTGEPIWTVEAYHHTLTADRAYVHFEGQLTAVDAETGAPQWTTPHGFEDAEFGAARFAVTSDVVVLTHETLGQTVAVDAETGEVRWRDTYGGGSYPRRLNDNVLVIGTSSPAAMHFVDADDGERRILPPEAEPGPVLESDGFRYILGRTAASASGEATWAIFDPDAEPHGSFDVDFGTGAFVVADGVIYVRHDDTAPLVGLSVPDGEELWSVELDQPYFEIVVGGVMTWGAGAVVVLR